MMKCGAGSGGNGGGGLGTSWQISTMERVIEIIKIFSSVTGQIKLCSSTALWHNANVGTCLRYLNWHHCKFAEQ